MRGSACLGIAFSLLVGCGDDGSSTGRDGGGTGADGSGGEMQLPCDVGDVIARNCLDCHQDPPILGAPMSLTSWAATHAPAETMPMQQVYELMRVRINSDTAPMPPAPRTMSDADRAILNAWIDAGAPTRAAGVSCGGVDGGTRDGGGVLTGVGPEHLPCTPTHTFTAHASGSDAPFHVPTDAGNLFECFSFRSPFAGHQATAWAPIIDDSRVVHHWILYSTQSPQTDGAVANCNMPSDAEFLMGWAPGGQNAVLPSDVGLELPDTSGYLILQVHYWNVAGHSDADDASGVAVCTTDPAAPRENEAGILWLGSVNIDIPPRATDHEVVGNCPSSVTSFLPEPMYILGNGPHMHTLGTRFTTKLFRGGAGGPEETIVHVDPWDFNSQAFYWHDTPIRLDPGDALETTCVYDNPGENAVRFGENTENEMCFDFVMVYPTRAFVGDQRRCIL